ncbi:carboxymuconolactone decarboxylase family protein [Promicromonospora thailandica]|uniref:4-carboxymuconolactone decarboxylase n=1 Tax=Promicromonospora thailandica TaxID=765201 RepID=A0A9X2GD18_9MICO|nr:carboxymuconolactone decarboxylase family protein [Promicromonospora thailandica]MCP2266331.1 4-carboxymuconolactone decarboxylase [Promicromonospora thailandica]BFF20002.1 carboxymuconolactone decarboxylase family protein [Promicromonospora thailandica]
MPNNAATRAERFASGMAALDSIHDDAGHGVIESLADIAPELGHQIVAWGYGDILSRPGLEPQQRQLVTLGILTGMGGSDAQLEVHIGASLNVGLTPQQIIEVFLQSAVYCGFPRALNAVAAARKVFAERGLLPLD